MTAATNLAVEIKGLVRRGCSQGMKGDAVTFLKMVGGEEKGQQRLERDRKRQTAS